MTADEPGPRTLAEAIEYRSYPSAPCACRGGPTCCILNSGRAHNLHRAAHIVARQLADLRDREALPPPTDTPG